MNKELEDKFIEFWDSKKDSLGLGKYSSDVFNFFEAHRKAELEEIMEEIEKKKQQLIQWGVKQPNWIIVFTDILQIIKSKI